MYIAKNLQLLRKRDKITQEDLADKLGVSRQSVSKWETGEAYPETDKLLALCDLFSVSLDALMRSDMSEATNSAPVPESEPTPAPPHESAPTIVPANGAAYIAHMHAFARAIALGVALVLLGIAACVALTGYAERLTAPKQSLAEVLGAVALFVFCAPAVFLFVLFGIRYDRFRRDNPVVENAFTPEQLQRFAKRFTIAMACLVSAILLLVAGLVLAFALLDAGVWRVTNKDATGCYITAVFFTLLAVVVGGLVYFGIEHAHHDVALYNKQTAREQNPSARSKLSGTVCGIIMMSATAVFFLLGFVWNLWHPGWVVFPIGGILCGIVSSLLDLRNRD